MLTMSVDVAALVEQLEQIRSNIPVAIENALNRAAEIAMQQKLAAEYQTYNRPIPTQGELTNYEDTVGHGHGPITRRHAKWKEHDAWHKANRKTLGIPKAGADSADNKPCWVRSTDWLRGQRIEEMPGERVVATEGNATDYEDWLADLSKCKFPSLGVDRSNPAAQKAMSVIGEQITFSTEQEIANALAKGDNYLYKPMTPPIPREPA